MRECAPCGMVTRPARAPCKYCHYYYLLLYLRAGSHYLCGCDSLGLFLLLLLEARLEDDLGDHDEDDGVDQQHHTGRGHQGPVVGGGVRTRDEAAETDNALHAVSWTIGDVLKKQGSEECPDKCCKLTMLCAIFYLLRA